MNRSILFWLIWTLSSCAHALVIYGHRGARGLAPENTLIGYEVALTHGVDYVDMDVVMTKDGVLVAHHDLTLNPDITRDAQGRWIRNNQLIIKNMKLAALQRYDVGKIKPQTAYNALFISQKSVEHATIPTLKAVIRYVKKMAGDKIGFQIEIKTDPTKPCLSASAEAIVMALDKIIKEEHIEKRTKVQAFDWRCLLLLHKLDPHIMTAFLTSVDQETMMRNRNPMIASKWTAGHLLKNYDSIPAMIHGLGGQWWDAQDIELTKHKIDLAHKLGLKVAAWSWVEQSGRAINVPLIRKLIAMQIDGVITDRPDIRF